MASNGGVRVREDETFESALRRFKKYCERSGIMTDMKRHRYHRKPSVQKNEKRRKAERKRQRDLEKEQRAYSSKRRSARRIKYNSWWE